MTLVSELWVWGMDKEDIFEDMKSWKYELIFMYILEVKSDVFNVKIVFLQFFCILRRKDEM